MNVSKEEAVNELAKIVMEADAYAKLHGLNILVFYDDNNDYNFNRLVRCTSGMLSQYIIHAYEMLPDTGKDYVVASIFEIEQKPDAPIQASVVKRKSWSLLWGLFTRYA